MKSRISDSLLSQLGDFIAAKIGLHFPRERWHDLELRICSAVREFGHQDVEAGIQWLVSSPLTNKQFGTLANHLTIGETSFFRNKKSFEILEEYIFPELIRYRRGGDRHLRIWSVGCSTGEEPYSIAILLSKMMPDLQDWIISILATDINPSFLEKASRGIYREWSFRDTPPWVKEKYFKRTADGCFEILPRLKKMVDFSFLNLAEDTYPSLLSQTNAMDVIFCRNVLMYFTAEQAERIIQKLYLSLVEGGWLAVSPVEMSSILFSRFARVSFPGGLFYRKDSPKSQTAEVYSCSLGNESQFSFQAPHAVTSKTGREAVFPHKTQKPHPLNIAKLKTEAAGPAPDMGALALFEKDHYTKAAGKNERGSPHNQDGVKEVVFRARAYANQGKLGQALEWAEKAIAAEKLNPAHHFLYATILQEQGQVQAAANCLKRILYLDPDFVLAHYLLGVLTRQQGKVKEAGKHLENAVSLLSSRPKEETIPESEGLTAGRLLQIIASITEETISG